ncbi:MAG TPA: phosphoribosylamine--glycine ligase [Casimicrobiaceae bacterium]|nr:phosphoribosylamine--glycine ligase [Casimicrobiaceae bacterium]
MKVLVVGGGGREHALAWKLAQSPRVTQVYVAPGNAGTGDEPDVANVDIVEVDALVAFAKQQGVGLTVVGPEAPLAAGIVDAFEAAGLRIFGPTRVAARLESSKDFAKAFMARHDIPTAPYRTFTEAAHAHAYVDAHGTPVVVTADGLAAGKGVVVATDAASAHHAIDAMLGAGAFGTAGARVVIEDFLDGEEASFIVMSDGRHVLALASSQDHKRLADGDRGPNTGGMGAYSPAPVVTPTVHARIMREVIAPAIEGMRAEGTPYRGFLYAGVMIDAAGMPRVLEFNCRLGDPEAQPILMRLRSDLVVLIEHALAGTLDRVDADWDRRSALTVVLAAHGYPGAPRRGDLIEGLERVNRDTHPDVSVFHAGTARDAEGVKATGGRVLGVTALGDSLRQAQRAAYAAIASIRFEGMQYRSDIGHRALARRGNA